MKVVFLCGGKGMRLQEHTVSIPKPLVEIGGQPILGHAMSWYASYGFREFVLCLGHLGAPIRERFSDCADWEVAFADTGEETQTGGRLKRIADHIEGDLFLCNYADGLSDLDLPALIDFHRAHGKTATLTAVRPRSQFGVLALEDERVTQFREKPRTEDWINGGFFVFHRRVFDSIAGDASVLETDVLGRLAAEGELMAYRHTGHWECMDTYKDTTHLNQLWESGEAFWKRWD